MINTCYARMHNSMKLLKMTAWRKSRLDTLVFRERALAVLLTTSIMGMSWLVLQRVQDRKVWQSLAI